MEHFQSLFALGGAFLVGLAAGYFFKKAFKISLFFTGAILVLLIYLEHSGIITINKKAIEQIGNEGVNMLKSAYYFIKSWLMDFKTAVAGAGFIAGLKIK